MFRKKLLLVLLVESMITCKRRQQRNFTLTWQACVGKEALSPNLTFISKSYRGKKFQCEAKGENRRKTKKRKKGELSGGKGKPKLGLSWCTKTQRLPTNSFTILELLKPPIVILYFVKKHWTTDFEALELWNGRSGCTVQVVVGEE